MNKRDTEDVVRECVKSFGHDCRGLSDEKVNWRRQFEKLTNACVDRIYAIMDAREENGPTTVPAKRKKLEAVASPELVDHSFEHRIDKIVEDIKGEQDDLEEAKPDEIANGYEELDHNGLGDDEIEEDPDFEEEDVAPEDEDDKDEDYQGKLPIPKVTKFSTENSTEDREETLNNLKSARWTPEESTILITNIAFDKTVDEIYQSGLLPGRSISAIRQHLRVVLVNGQKIFKKVSTKNSRNGHALTSKGKNIVKVPVVVRPIVIRPSPQKAGGWNKYYRGLLIDLKRKGALDRGIIAEMFPDHTYESVMAMSLKLE
jgi:hypothetical protein